MRPDPDPPPPVLPSRRSKLITEPPAEAKKEFVLRIPAPVLKQTKESEGKIRHFLLACYCTPHTRDRGQEKRLQKLRQGDWGKGKKKTGMLLQHNSKLRDREE